MSNTLRQAHAEAEYRHGILISKGYGGSGSRVNARAFTPNDRYPAPWFYTTSPEGICTIYAANKEKVADWLNRREAEQIIAEIAALEAGE